VLVTVILVPRGWRGLVGSIYASLLRLKWSVGACELDLGVESRVGMSSRPK